MASVRRRGASWYVQWKELVVTRQGDGTDSREWRTRGRSFPGHADAKLFKNEIEIAQARGERWTDKRGDAVVTIRIVALAFVRAAVEAGAPIATQRFRSSMIGGFLDFLGAREEGDPGVRIGVGDLSLTLLERFANSLPGEGRQATTRYRKVMESEKMWAWAHNRPERFPGVPSPRRYTGGSADADKLSAPAPVVAVAAPIWADVDAMIGELKIEWHRRAAILMRFTGLRASQACGLRWQDVDLERGVLRIRARVRGAKGSRARVIPLHPWLTEQMTGWGMRDGLLFPRRYKGTDGKPRLDPYRGDALVMPFRRAWTAAKFPVERWGKPDGGFEERGKGSPTHAVRRCIRTELVRSGVEEALVLYLVGQTCQATRKTDPLTTRRIDPPPSTRGRVDDDQDEAVPDGVHHASEARDEDTRRRRGDRPIAPAGLGQPTDRLGAGNRPKHREALHPRWRLESVQEARPCSVPGAGGGLAA